MNVNFMFPVLYYIYSPFRGFQPPVGNKGHIELRYVENILHATSVLAIIFYEKQNSSWKCGVNCPIFAPLRKGGTVERMRRAKEITGSLLVINNRRIYSFIIPSESSKK